MNTKNKLNIGDSYLKTKNVEDISSLHIYKLDDVYELSLTENAYIFELIAYADTNILSFSEN
jgi:hypothetical protein